MPSAATVAELAVVVTADVSQAEKGLTDLGTKVGSAGSMLTTAFTGAAVAGIAAVGAGLAECVSAASGFESTMSGVKAVSGATADEMSQLSGLALQLGKDTSFSASEAGKGIEELVKGGLTIPDIMNGAAEATLNLAAAGGVSLPDAATIAANALAEFNLKGSDMAHVSDLIAGAANASALDVSDFKFSLSSAGAVAATVGFSFDDLAQGIAVMGKAGITGSDAGTSLKTMMMNLVPATNAASDTMRQLGIITGATGPIIAKLQDGLAQTALGQDQLAKLTKSGLINSEEDLFKALDKVNPALTQGASSATDYGVKVGLLGNQFFDANGKVKSMADVAEVLKGSLAGMSQEQELATLRTLFGSDAIRAAAVLAKEGAAGFDDMADAMSKVTAASVGAEKLNNLSGSWEQMKGSIETLSITIGMQLLPALRAIVDASTSVINALIPIAEKYVPELVAAFQTNFQPAVQWFVDNWPLIQQTYHTVATAIGSDNDAMATNFSSVFGAMSLTTAQHMGEIGDTLRLAMHVINGDWSAAWADLTSISDREQKIQNANAEANGAIGLALLDKFTGGMITRFTDSMATARQVISDGWAGIQTVTETMWIGASGIAATIATAWSTIATDTQTAGQALHNVIVGIWDAIYTSVIQPRLDAIVTAVGAAWDAISVKTHEVLDPILIYIRDNIYGPISDFITTSVNAARDAFGAALDTMSQKAHAVLDPILTYIRDNIFEPIQAAVEAAMTGPKGAATTFDSAISQIKATVDSTLSDIKSVWETTWSAIQTAAQSPAQAMNELITLVDKLKSVMPEWLIPHSPTPFQIGLEGIMKAAQDANSKVTGFLAGTGKVPGALDDWLNAAIGVSGVGSDWLDGLRWLAMHESTGNPKAVNPFDVNNVLNGPGPHAMGLMQTIPSTFRAYRNKDLSDDIFDPVANAAASIGYIKATYGSIQNVISGWERRGGYESGGWAGLHGPELAWLGEGGPEYVIPNNRLGGGAGGHQTLTVNVAIGGRLAEQIVVEGYELAASRGRLPTISRGRLPTGMT